MLTADFAPRVLLPQTQDEVYRPVQIVVLAEHIIRPALVPKGRVDVDLRKRAGVRVDQKER